MLSIRTQSQKNLYDKMEQKPPLMMLPLSISKKLAKPFHGLTHRLSKNFPEMKKFLLASDLEMSVHVYLANSLVNVIFMFLLFFGLLFILSYRIQMLPFGESLKTTTLYTFGIALLITYALLTYPKVLAGKKAEQVDKSLIYALKDLLLQISSDVSLYNGLVNVSEAGYGLVSEEFEKVAQHVNTGMPMADALERMAVDTESEYMKRTTWQLINTLNAGASLKSALKSIVKDLTIEQRTKIKGYANELNLWSLIYMLFAVAVPTIGAVMLVILSSFGGMGVSKGMFIIFIVICFFIQYVLIGFVKARRPVVQF